MSAFPSTLWTVIEDARRGLPEALERFVLRYRPALAAYLRRRGLEREAEDLAQEVFIRLFLDGVLTRAQRESGRFRHLLSAVTRNVIGNHVEKVTAAKRGGGKVEALGERDLASPEPDDDAFDQEWISHVLALALGRLAEENPRYHEVLSLTARGKSHEEIADAVHLSWGQVKDAVHRGKKKLAALVREEIRSYSTSEAEVADELDRLARFLPE